MRLLLCEDERAFSDALCAILEHNNYTVDAVYDGEDAYTYGLSDNYDGILLDIMMPIADGLTVLQRLRAAGVQTPMLLLTAKSEVEDRVAGLNLGADDYLPKPFVMAELLARVRALTRRIPALHPTVRRSCAEPHEFHAVRAARHCPARRQGISDLRAVFVQPAAAALTRAAAHEDLGL